MKNRTVHSILKDIFGYDNFRPGQDDIVRKIVDGHNVLAVMPTGAGKSLCYQIPAIFAEFKSVVISPLVALIDDQTSALRENGIQVSAIHSGQSREENIEQWRQFAGESAQILYLSPERLMQPRMIEALQKLNVGMFVVDEAHCISKWGADFRPDYEELSKIRDFFPKSIITAFTATADKATRTDIVDKLTKGDCSVFVRGFDRPNLSLTVLTKEASKAQIIGFLENRREESGIIYTLSRKEADDLAQFLCDKGFNAIAYHAGKTHDYRKGAQNRFMTEDAVVMVATIAFGMGIDKPDIRYVLHASLPASVEAFYQEIGRAGRDGATADTVLLYGVQDLIRRQRMIFESGGGDHHKLLEYKRLEALVGYCETASCRRLALLSYFDEVVSECGNCDNCISPPSVEDTTALAQSILTTILETGQFFGINHIIDVLRGSDNEKISSRSHQRVSTFGTATDSSKLALQSIIRQLAAQGAVRFNLEKYGALEVTITGQEILRGSRSFLAKKQLQTSISKKHEKSRYSESIAIKHPDLLASLKKLRLNIARDRKVPAFVIFSDKSLNEMANLMPTSRDEFLSINGVGKAKLEEFFEPFVNVIKNFSDNRRKDSNVWILTE